MLLKLSKSLIQSKIKNFLQVQSSKKNIDTIVQLYWPVKYLPPGVTKDFFQS